ncbi:MAG: hypothetical protein ACI91O_001135, partial [Candidatus Poriferisodalaceae bacterium]
STSSTERRSDADLGREMLESAPTCESMHTWNGWIISTNGRSRVDVSRSALARV